MNALGEKIVSTIFAGVESTADPADNFRGHLGCSILGDECERKSWFTFHWYTQRNLPGRILRLFDRGKREEAPLVEAIRSAHIEVQPVNPSTNRQWSFTDPDLPHLGGSADGISRGWFGNDTWVGLEFKTAAGARWREFDKKGVKATSPTYHGQVQSMMRLSHLDCNASPPLNAFIEIIVNKDTDDLYAELIPRDIEAGEILKAKAARVFEASHPTEVERISEYGDFYLCKFCDHSSICHGYDDAVPAPTCRSCAHVQLTARTWRCGLKRRRLSRKASLAGCSDYVAQTP